MSGIDPIGRPKGPQKSSSLKQISPILPNGEINGHYLIARFNNQISRFNTCTYSDGGYDTTIDRFGAYLPEYYYIKDGRFLSQNDTLRAKPFLLDENGTITQKIYDAMLKADPSFRQWTVDDGERECIKSASLPGINFKGADLSRVNFKAADFTVADLRRANFSRAKLFGACFSRADLCEANLCEANLWATSFLRADLSMADLSMANLTGANFSGAVLNNALLLNNTFEDSLPILPGCNTFDDATSLNGTLVFGTKLPNSFSSVSKNNLNGLIYYNNSKKPDDPLNVIFPEGFDQELLEESGTAATEDHHITYNLATAENGSVPLKNEQISSGFIDFLTAHPELLVKFNNVQLSNNLKPGQLKVLNQLRRQSPAEILFKAKRDFDANRAR